MSKAKKEKLDLNPKFLQALDLMENSDQHIFVTGRAGTGKSTLLEYFRQKTKKEIVVLAPTGVAAVNIQGQTIHSFFRFKPDTTLDKVKKIVKKDKINIYQHLDAIVIDEISMVRADLLDCVDKFLRLNRDEKNLPFGGLQMIFIGDLYQLPPVVSSAEKQAFKSQYATSYFFSSQVFQNLGIKFVELEKVYRQKDQRFINILNKVRNRSVEEEDLAILNALCDPGFEPRLNQFYVHLTPTNQASQIVNEIQLNKLKTPEHYFQGRLQGDFKQDHLPTQIDLYLKKGAQIMMLNNDSRSRWINGTIGKIVSLEKKPKEEPGSEALDPGSSLGPFSAPAKILVELETGLTESIEPYTWEIFRYDYNPDTQSIHSEIIGSFTQYPLKLAWSVTIHKSQGKTFDKVILDIGRGTFAHGQLYVALSRCTSLKGLVLKRPLEKRHILMDYQVVKFLTNHQYQLSNQKMPLEQKIKIIQQAIDDNQELKIEYLRANDEKSSRLIQPQLVGEMEYSGKKFIGLQAFCHTRQDVRVFRVDRILSIQTN